MEPLSFFKVCLNLFSFFAYNSQHATSLADACEISSKAQLQIVSV